MTENSIFNVPSHSNGKETYVSTSAFGSYINASPCQHYTAWSTNASRQAVGLATVAGSFHSRLSLWPSIRINSSVQKGATKSCEEVLYRYLRNLLADSHPREGLLAPYGSLTSYIYIYIHTTSY